MATVVALGTLGAKGAEYACLAERLREHGVDVLMDDAGMLGEPSLHADVTRAVEFIPAGGQFWRPHQHSDAGANRGG